MKITDVSTVTVGVTERTNWIHVVVTDDEGHHGVGEATLDGMEAMVVERVRQIAVSMVGSNVASIAGFVAGIGIEDTPGGLINAAAVSGIEQALWDLHGKRIGQPVHMLLGVPEPRPLPVYANVNRALLDDRSPAAFAAVAEHAIATGFTAVKIAPFDGLVRTSLEDRSDRKLVTAGLDRIAAVRKAIGDEHDLLIDCHWRFTARSAVPIMDDLGSHSPFWVEAPVAEHRLDEWGEIRSRTALRLAGGEMMTGLVRFARFIRDSGVDVVMPDIKYVGGVSGLRDISSLAASESVAVAPHNPSGPVGALASFHATCGLSNTLILEYAYGECDWRSSLVAGAEIVEKGHLLPPTGSGFGGMLDAEVVAAHPQRAVRGMSFLGRA